MTYPSYTKSRSVTNTPTRFVARCCHIQVGTSSQRLVSKICPTMCCRNAHFRQESPFIKIYGGHLDDGPLKSR